MGININRGIIMVKIKHRKTFKFSSDYLKDEILSRIVDGEIMELAGLFTELTWLGSGLEWESKWEENKFV